MRQGLIPGVLGIAAFSLTLPFTRMAVLESNPLDVFTLRLLIASLVAVLVLLVTRAQMLPRHLWRNFSLVCAGVVFGFPFFTSMAMDSEASAHGGVVLGVLPLATAVTASIMSKERPTAAFWWTAVTGSVLVIAFSFITGSDADSSMTAGISHGDIYLFLAIVSASVGYAAGGSLSRVMPAWQVISWALALCLPVGLILLTTVDYGALQQADSKNRLIGSLLYLGLISQYGGFLLWYRALALDGVARASQIQLLQPFLTLIGAWFPDFADDCHFKKNRDHPRRMMMQGTFYYLLAVLIWGSTWYAIRFQLGVVDESVSLVYRFGLAAVLLICWCLLRGISLRFKRRDHLAMAAQGACLFSINYLLFYWCTGVITSGLVAVIFSTVIVMNIFNGAIFLKRSIQPLVLLAALIGLVGIVMVFWDEIQNAQGARQDDVLGGLGIGLVATFFASLGNILSARNQSVGLPVVQTNAIGMAYGALIMTLYAWITGTTFTMDWSAPYVLSLLYLSVFGSIIAFGAYLTLVGQIGADRAAYATVLFPIVALFISSIFEGFQWTSLSITGVALVLMGNVLGTGRVIPAGLCGYRSVSQDETNLHRDAVLSDFTVIDQGFLLLDPDALDVLQRLVGAFNALFDCVVKSFG